MDASNIFSRVAGYVARGRTCGWEAAQRYTGKQSRTLRAIARLGVAAGFFTITILVYGFLDRSDVHNPHGQRGRKLPLSNAVYDQTRNIE